MECRYPTGCHGPRRLRTLCSVDRLPRTSVDIDPEETAEWRDSFQSLLTAHGPARAVIVKLDVA